nr:MAG TPA: hypothetical protein [Caudoviricetes sp.]
MSVPVVFSLATKFTPNLATLRKKYVCKQKLKPKVKLQK